MTSTKTPITSASELLAAYAAGQRDFRGAILQDAILQDADLRGADLRGADLRGANLRYANLLGANLRDADLRGADLRGANLQDTDLRYANLLGANLQDTDLRGANLCYSDLRGANLQDTDLRYANLQYANLRSADLRSANLGYSGLQGVNLQGANVLRTRWPAPSIVLLAQWGEVSDDLCVELMRYDASCHPNPESFDEWAKGGLCLYEGVSVQRVANFLAKEALWSPGPASSAYQLMCLVLAEKCAGSDPGELNPYKA